MNNRVKMVKSEVINTKPPLGMLEINGCNIPYYRCFSKCCHDSVLVKDIGITCELLKVTKLKKYRRKSSPIINHNVKKTKSDNTNEISSITRRISSYTRDMFNNLTMKINKRQYPNDEKLNIGKIPIATEYLDQNGQSTLRLRLHDSDDFSQCYIDDYSPTNNSEKSSKSKLQVIYPPVKTSSDESAKSQFSHSINGYLIPEKVKSNADEINVENSCESPIVNGYTKSRHAAAILSDWWSNVNLNAINNRINKHK